MPDMDKLYSIQEVADHLGLSYKTIWKWCRVEKTVRVVVLDSGTIRIPGAELQRLTTQTEPTEARTEA
jgi:predicted site-specific integrase-resolvase